MSVCICGWCRFTWILTSHTRPGSNWRPSACEADAKTIRPKVLLLKARPLRMPEPVIAILNWAPRIRMPTLCHWPSVYRTHALPLSYRSNCSMILLANQLAPEQPKASQQATKQKPRALVFKVIPWWMLAELISWAALSNCHFQISKVLLENHLRARFATIFIKKNPSNSLYNQVIPIFFRTPRNPKS